MLTDTPVLGRAFLEKSGFHSMATWLVALAITSVFAVDCLTPLGIEIPFFYILIPWVTLAWAPSQVLIVTAASSVLTIIGMFLSPEGELRADLTNRAITLVTLWLLAYFCMAYRKAIDTLCERERELKDFVENAPVGIHWIVSDGTILWANQEALDMLGYDRNEYVGRNVIEFHVDRDVAEDILGKLNTNVPLKDRMARLRKKDGSIRHVLISCNFRREDGRFIHDQYFTQDITDSVHAKFAKSESKQHELLEQRVHERTAQLRQSEERLNFLLRTSRTGGWDLDLVDHTAHRTLEHDRIFGYDSLLPQWTYERFLEHVLSEDRAEVDRRFRKAIAARTEWSFECRIRRADGEVRWIWAAGEHQRDEAGQTRRMAGIVQDTTERKLAEQALLESKRRLRLAYEDRERLSRDLHDNIIQAIYAIGMQLEACQRLPRDDPKDVAEQLAQAISGLNGVIRDVRGYISSSGPQNLSEPRLRVELAGLVKAIGATGTLRFRLNVDPLAAARLTPPQAEHVLHIAREALSNALKHSQARQGRLSLHRAGNSVCLEVSDDGVGFEPKTLGGKGTGLRNMETRVRQIGAKLKVLSSSGQGTRIILTFPEAKEVHAVE